jgi:hypothetical protein
VEEIEIVRENIRIKKTASEDAVFHTSILPDCNAMPSPDN